jgi:predicted DNA-binding WGR domain protein
MRRFEFVEGTSAKFWMADVEGNNFIVVYGRLGSDGQRKEKAFPSPDAARKEYDKKVAEKLREGYHEVAADAAAHAPSGAKGAAAASAPLQLPARLHPHSSRPESITTAIEALKALKDALGSRSWVVARAAHRARRALRAVSGLDPASQPPLQAALDAVLERVAAPRASDRLPLKHALGLLYQLDAHAFTRALGESWKNVGSQHPARDAVALLTEQLEQLKEPELGLRVGTILLEPTESASGHSFWRKQWSALAPHLEAYLVRSHGSLKQHLGAVAQAHPAAAARTRALLG